MKKVKLSDLISLNSDAVQVLQANQMKKIYGGDGDGNNADGNDATGGPPDLNTGTVSGPPKPKN